MASLNVRVLGGFEVKLDSGQAVSITGRKSQALLAFLVLPPGERRTRDKLTALLWSERGEQQARSSLRQALTELRKALPDLDPPLLIAERDTVHVDPDAVEVDAVAFDRLVDQGAPGTLATAAELYRGDLLDGLDVRDAAFEEWLGVERERLRDRAGQALRSLLEQQTGDEAIATARRLLMLDPLNEATHRALMRLYAEAGDRSLAIKQYNACRQLLQAELGLKPEADTERLVEEIRQGEPGEAERRADHILAETLKTTDEPPLPDKPSIAVLPFTNMSGDPEQEYFSDGITEDIITGLSRFRELFVIARTSVFTYKGRPAKVQDVGRELGVQYIVEGSVRKAGNRVRVSAQLVDAMTGSHVWAERYDRELEDIFAVQDEITETVVATLAGRLGDLGVDRARRKPTESLTAFDYVLHARQLIYLYKRESILKARDLLEKAVALDSDYATAHAWLSETYWAEWWAGWTADAGGSFERFARHAAQAVALDDTDSEAHIQMGQVCLNRHQYDEARFHFDKALSLNPNQPDAMMMQAFYSMYVGDPERAVAQINEAIRIDPLGHYGVIQGIAYYSARNYEEAIAAFKTVRGEVQSVQAWLAACHAQMGHREDAEAAAAEFVARTTKAMAQIGARLPASWMEFFAERHPYKHADDLDQLLDGLRKAGLD